MISAFEMAVENGSLKDASTLLGDEYRDQYHPSKAAAMRSLFAYTRRHRDIHLFTRIHEVEIDSNERLARAVVLAAMTGKPVDTEQQLLTLKADLYRFELSLAWDDGEHGWRIINSRWQRADLGLLTR